MSTTLSGGLGRNPNKRPPEDCVINESAKRIAVLSKTDLCVACQSVSWSQLEKDIPTSRYGKVVMTMPTSRATLEHSSCPICRLIFLITPEPFESKSWQLKAFSSSLSFDYISRSHRNGHLALDKSVPQCTVLFTVARTEGTKDNVPRKWHQRGCLGFRPMNQENPNCGPRLIIQQSIDYDLIRHWIADCKKTHKERCSPISVNTIQNLRVIDCKTRSVIDAPRDCRYVALSYVWGSQDPCQANKFAPVVEDSIKVVLQLGLKYLWVDKHCIDQEDCVKLMEQVAQMDRVYAAANLTIIAAAGNNDRYGLPGVSQRARRPQEVVELGDTQLVEIFPHTSSVLNSTTWATRGWTYQEGMFSKRRLIFTDDQVSYLCNTMHCAETADMPPEKLKLQIGHPFEAIMSPLRPMNDHQAIKTYIMEYSKRHLSKDSDALNAILGIFNSLQSFRRKTINHLFGVPVAMAPKISISLGWFHEKSCTRRDTLPSWSWTGWRGAVKMIDPDVRNSTDCTIIIGNQSLDQYLQGIHSTLPQAFNSPISLLVTGQAVTISLQWRDWASQNNSFTESFSQRSQKAETSFLVGFHAMLSVSANTTAWVYAYLDKAIKSETEVTGLLGLVLGKEVITSVVSIMLLDKVGDCYERIGILRYRKATGTQDSAGSTPYIIYVDEDGESIDELADIDSEPIWLKEAKEVTVQII